MLRKFRDDFNAKINLCEDNDFYYYVNLYGLETQLQMLKTVSLKYGEEKFFSYYQELRAQVSFN